MHHILENLGRHANRLARRDEEESVADIDGIEAHFYGETDLADQVARVSANYTAADAMMGWAPKSAAQNAAGVTSGSSTRHQHLTFDIET